MQFSTIVPQYLKRYAHNHRNGSLSAFHMRSRHLLQGVSLLIVAFVMIPVLYLIVRAVGAGQEGIDYLLTERTLQVIGNSTVLMISVTLFASLIGVPYAWLTARSDLPYRQIWLILGLLAMVIPSYLTAVTYTEAFGPKGLLQNILESVGVDRLPNIKGWFGATLTLTMVTFPYIILPVRAALLHSDPALEEAGQSLGLNRIQVFWKITLPLLRPALSAGMLITALYTLSDFGAVAVMRFNAFTRAIFIQTESYRMDKASVLALVLIVMTLILLIVQASIRNRGRHYRIGTGARRELNITQLGKWKYPAMLFCSLVIFISVLVPLLVLFTWLIGRTMSNPVDVAMSELMQNTIGVSAISAITVTLMAFPLALLAMRSSTRFNRWLVNLAFTGNVLPGIVIALALVYFASQNVLSLYQTLPLLIMGYTIRYLPLSISSTQSAFAQINPRFEEVARSLGLSSWEVVARITIPLARSGIIAGLALVFLNVMKELPTTLILRPIGFRTFATRIWSAYGEAFLSSIAIPGLLLIIVSAFALVIILWREDKAY